MIAIAATCVLFQAGNAAAAGCQDSWTNASGGTWTTGSDWSMGAPPTASQSACITIGLSGPVTLAGTMTADGLTIGGGNGSDELISTAGDSLTLTSGSTLINSGEIAVTGGQLTLSGQLVNQSGGTIAVEGGAVYVSGPFSLSNEGTIVIAPGVTFELSGDAPQTIDNVSGTIANDGTLTVEDGGTFEEGAGTTTGNPVQVLGTLSLAGSGSSSFLAEGSLSGTIAATQTLNTIYSAKVVAADSFTNFGNLDGGGTLALPSGDTLTNDGTISTNAFPEGFTVEGNLDNTTTGLINAADQGLSMGSVGTTFDNAGQLYMPFDSIVGLTNSGGNNPTGNAFFNTGTMYVGVNANDGEWGTSGLTSQVEPFRSDSVSIGGTVVPLPFGEPKPWTPPEGTTIVYGLAAGGGPGSPPSYTLSCSANIAEGWTMPCSNASGVALTDELDSTLVPTEVASITGSGTANGTGGFTQTFGVSGAITATISAQDASMPTGTVTFVGRNSTFDSTAAGVIVTLGTGTLSTSGGVTSASISTTKLTPGQWEILAIYSGDATHLPSSTEGYDVYVYQQVTPQATTVALRSAANPSPTGSPAKFTATVSPAPASSAPVGPTGQVELIDSSDGSVLAVAPVTIGSGGFYQATMTTSQLTSGSTQLIARYSGDENFSASTSIVLKQTEGPPATPAISHLTQSHSSWQRGTALAVVTRNVKSNSRSKSKRAPVGTTFKFDLTEPAKVTFKFETGKHLRSAGSLAFGASAGANRVAFDGRLSGGRKLAAGRYTLVVTARSAAGKNSVARRISFTIV